MAAFEFNSNKNNDNNFNPNNQEFNKNDSKEIKIQHTHNSGHHDKLDLCRLRDEPIITQKVYDSCRQQDCLTEDQIGPARAGECVDFCEHHIKEGDVIVPPSKAAAVTIDKLRVKKIIIVDKKPNTFKNGYWDVDLKYVFEYRLTFREADGCTIGSIKANSIYNKKVTLFGSVGTDLVISTDLFNSNNNSSTLDADPFILVEAKAVALTAIIKYSTRRPNGSNLEVSPEPSSVNITLGLFAIVKLFRLVTLNVQSHGFEIPVEDSEEEALHPCDFFDNLDFPMDVFAPPQKPEFFSGIVNNIPNCNNK